jgi:hypothetical protein
MNLSDLVRRADELVALGTKALDRASDAAGYGVDSIPSDVFSEFKSASLSFLDRTFGEKGAYATEFRAEVKDTWKLRTEHGIGILRAARDEMAGGWMVTTRGLVTAEVVPTFLRWQSTFSRSITRMPAL